MAIPFTRWYPAIPRRRSRRSFDSGRSIAAEKISNLADICANFQPFEEARAELITQSPERIFNFVLGSYGLIRGAPLAIAFIGDMHSSYVQESVGYTGEGIILEATTLGLGSCWVAGFFRPEAVKEVIPLNNNERVLAVTPIGYPNARVTGTEKLITGFGRTHHRKPLDKLVSGLPEINWPVWIKPALEAARSSPSAINRQPWRFQVETNSIAILTGTPRLNTRVSQRLDCGIAMLHIEVTALNFGIHGVWERLDPPQVARFKF